MPAFSYGRQREQNKPMEMEGGGRISLLDPESF